MGANTAYWICAQTGVNPLAIGMPGVAKSETTYAFGKVVGRSIYTLIGGLRDPADIGGYPYPGEIGVNGHTKTVMKLIPPQWAADCCDNGHKWIIFLDELTTCAPAVQAALLRVMAEKVVGDLPLPRDTWIIGACNPPEQAANGIELEAAMANRMYHHKWELDQDAVLEGYTNGLTFPEPSFPRLPQDWERHLVGQGGMVAAFHHRNPGRLCQFPEDRAQQGGAWPSPRTWEYSIRCLAAAESVKAEKGTQLTLLSGLVGDAVATEFAQWRENLDLPDPEVLIKAASAAIEDNRDMTYHHPDRPDKVMAMLAAVNQAVLNNNTPKRWEAGMRVMYEASRHEMDVALAGAKPMVNPDNMPKGAKLSAEFVKELFPRIHRALEN